MRTLPLLLAFTLLPSLAAARAPALQSPQGRHPAPGERARPGLEGREGRQPGLEHRERIREAVRRLDLDGDGRIDAREAQRGRELLRESLRGRAEARRGERDAQRGPRAERGPRGCESCGPRRGQVGGERRLERERPSERGRVGQRFDLDGDGRLDRRERALAHLRLKRRLDLLQAPERSRAPLRIR